MTRLSDTPSGRQRGKWRSSGTNKRKYQKFQKIRTVRSRRKNKRFPKDHNSDRQKAEEGSISGKTTTTMIDKLLQKYFILRQKINNEVDLKN